MYNTTGTVTLGNTIVAGNTAATSGPDAFGTFTSLGNNLIGETDGSSGWVGSDLTGTIAQPLNAAAGPAGQLRRADRRPWPCCPAARRSTPATTHLVPAGITTDQRGEPRFFNGTVDIGAYELQAVIVPSFVVNTTADFSDPTDGTTSLREAIASANALPGQHDHLRPDRLRQRPDDHSDRRPARAERHDRDGDDHGPGGGRDGQRRRAEPGVPGRRGCHGVDLGPDDHRRHDRRQSAAAWTTTAARPR